MSLLSWIVWSRKRRANSRNSHKRLANDLNAQAVSSSRSLSARDSVLHRSLREVCPCVRPSASRARLRPFLISKIRHIALCPSGNPRHPAPLFACPDSIFDPYFSRKRQFEQTPIFKKGLSAPKKKILTSRPRSQMGIAAGERRLSPKSPLTNQSQASNYGARRGQDSKGQDCNGRRLTRRKVVHNPSRHQFESLRSISSMEIISSATVRWNTYSQPGQPSRMQPFHTNV